MKKELSIISHTHWDREWYMPRELMRMRLVDLIDNLLDILDHEPTYIFHLDAQTIVLEDYLEIRPHKKPQLEKLIKEGRLLVGPWYVQNDFYLSSGESTVRNLMLGIEMAESFGECMKVGYVPDQFGLIGQLPQILHLFGIDNCIFGRGLDRIVWEDGNPTRETVPTEFYWRGSDNTKVLSIHMRNWYNNAQRILPNKEQAVQQLEALSNSFEKVAQTPYRLLMNGVDHLEPQENLLSILREVAPVLEKSGKQVSQTRLDTYINHIQEYINQFGVNLGEEKGELRYGNDLQILQGTLSSRVYIKQINDFLEERLLSQLEPLYTYIFLQGAPLKYPSDYFRYLWKTLIQNLAHDSICGCSVDAVHSEMEMRYQCINQISGELLERGLEFIANHTPVNGDYPLFVFNPLPYLRSGVLHKEIDIPVSEKIENFKIVDENGIELPASIKYCGKKLIDRYSPINLPEVIECNHFELTLFVDNMPALGSQVYYIKKEPLALSSVSDEIQSISNEYFQLSVDSNGGITLNDKRSGNVWKNLFWLEDTADTGSSYIFRPLYNDSPINCQHFLTSFSYETNNLTNTLSLHYKLSLPCKMDIEKRSSQLTEMPVKIRLTLEKGSPFLRLYYQFENNAKDHRLRLIVRTGIESDETISSAPYEMVRRLRGDGVVPGLRGSDQPNSGVIAIEGCDRSFAIFNIGLHEYEHLVRKDGQLALTLVRSNDVINRNLDGEITGGSKWRNITGNQCLRTIEGEIALFPYYGSYVEENILRLFKEFRNPLLSHVCSNASLYGNIGQAAVQESGISQRAVRPELYDNLSIQPGKSLLSVEGKGIEVTAIKKADTADTIVLRLCNSSEVNQKVKINTGFSLYRVTKAHANEQGYEDISIHQNMVSFTSKPFEIITLLLYKGEN